MPSMASERSRPRRKSSSWPSSDRRPASRSGMMTRSSSLRPDGAAAALRLVPAIPSARNGRERRVGEAQVARIAGVAPGRMPGPRRQPDERRDVGMDRPLELRDDRPPGWAGPPGPADRVGVAGQALARGVLAPGTDQRANDDEPVHHPGQPRHVLADVEARARRSRSACTRRECPTGRPA